MKILNSILDVAVIAGIVTTAVSRNEIVALLTACFAAFSIGLTIGRIGDRRK